MTLSPEVAKKWVVAINRQERAKAALERHFIRGAANLPLVEAIASAITEAENEAQAWRPIETAPKDGSLVLLFSVTEGQDVGHWEVTYAEGFEWMDAQGYSISGVTHWMPLPPSPIPKEPA